MGQDPRHVVAVAKQVHAIGDFALRNEPFKPRPLRSVTDNEHVEVVAGHLEDVGRPDDVLHPLLRPEPSTETINRASSGRPNSRQTSARVPSVVGAGGMPLGMIVNLPAGSPLPT
ncbi:MAG: hypothetical protein R3C10_06785 [Pirellulales bacterium]